MFYKDIGTYMYHYRSERIKKFYHFYKESKGICFSAKRKTFCSSIGNSILCK